MKISLRYAALREHFQSCLPDVSLLWFHRPIVDGPRTWYECSLYLLAPGLNPIELIREESFGGVERIRIRSYRETDLPSLLATSHNKEAIQALLDAHYDRTPEPTL